MVTINDFKQLVELERANGPGLCQYVGYCFASKETNDFITESNIEGLVKRLISSYTGLLFQPLNYYLREEPPHAIIPILIAFGLILNESLATVPSYDNSIVYRNELGSSRDEVRGWFSSCIGKVVEFPSFLSTYHDRTHWKHAEPGFEIQTKENSRAKHVAGYIDKPGEAEILFQSNTRFKVLEVTDFVRLQETEEPADCTLWQDYYLNPINEGPVSPSDLENI